MAIEQQWPEVLAMVIADVVHRDKGTGKFSILGTYRTIGAEEFPFPCPEMAVYLVLTDGHGETELKIRLVDVDEIRTPVFEAEFPVSFTDPTDIIEMAFVQPDVNFPEPGEYCLQLFGAGHFLRERRVWVLRRQDPDADNER